MTFFALQKHTWSVSEFQSQPAIWKWGRGLAIVYLLLRQGPQLEGLHTLIEKSPLQLPVEYTCVGDRQSGPARWVGGLPAQGGGSGTVRHLPMDIRMQSVYPGLAWQTPGRTSGGISIGDVENTISVHLGGYCENLCGNNNLRQQCRKIMKKSEEYI